MWNFRIKLQGMVWQEKKNKNLQVKILKLMVRAKKLMSLNKNLLTLLKVLERKLSNQSELDEKKIKREK